MRIVLTSKIKLLLFLLLPFAANAQDPFFNQHFGMPLLLNPAFAGYEGCSRVAFAFRNQWTQTNGPITSMISYDQAVKPLHGGIAFSYLYDLVGSIKNQTHAVKIDYAPIFRLFQKRLNISPAIEIGGVYKSYDLSKLVFASQYDPSTGTTSIRAPDFALTDHLSFLDIGSGILITHGNFAYGASARHINLPAVSFIDHDPNPSKMAINYTFHISWQYRIADSISLCPAYVYIYQGGFKINQPMISAAVYGFKAGIGIMVNANYVIILGYHSRHLAVAYSYDSGMSSGLASFGGSHEVSLSYRFHFKDQAELRKGPDMPWF